MPSREIRKRFPSFFNTQWHQKFTLFMPGDPVTEQPFDRTGTKLDLSDPQGPHRSLENA